MLKEAEENATCEQVLIIDLLPEALKESEGGKKRERDLLEEISILNYRENLPLFSTFD